MEVEKIWRPVGQHEGLRSVAEVQVGQHPRDEVLPGEDGGNLGHEALHRSHGNARVLLEKGKELLFKIFRLLG
jgi:hypothetical protein